MQLRLHRRLLSWTLGLAGMVAGTALLDPAAAQTCPGDCDGNGRVTINELITAVRIALDGTSTSAQVVSGADAPEGGSCQPADSNGDGVVRIEELIRAVRAALDGCPAAATPSLTSAPATATETPTGSVAPTATPSVAPTGDPTAEPTPTFTVPTDPTAEPTATATGAAPTASPTSTQTSTPTPTFTVPTDPTAEPTATATGAAPTASPTSTQTSTPTPTFTVPTDPTAEPTATATGAAPTASPTSTQTLTPTPTFTVPAAPTNTPPTPLSPLGMRRFTLDPATSGITTVTTGGQLDTFGMTGYLELSAGSPDPMTGLAQIDVTGASDYLALDLSPGALCIRPIVPAPAAGSIYCGPGVASSASADLSGFGFGEVGLELKIKHRIGQIGEDITLELCIEAGGTPEGPSDPHPGTCVGPLRREANTTLQLETPGSIVINGLLAEVTTESDLPCGDEGVGGEAVPFDLVSNTLRTTIEDVNGVDGETLVYEQSGQPASCPAWLKGSLGSLVHGTPIIHGAGSGDLELFIFFRSLFPGI